MTMCMSWAMLKPSVIWLVVLLLDYANGDTRECCRHIPNRDKYIPCKDSCEQAWMSSGPLQQIEIFSTTYRQCPINILLNFWECVGINYPILTDIEAWEGRACCELAQSTECQQACHAAHSTTDLGRSCVEQEEVALYSCAKRQSGNEACCRNIRSTRCKAACRAMFVSDSPPDQELEDNLNAMCDSHIKQCVSNWTQQHEETTLPTKSLQCCHKGTTTVCKQTCVQAFTSLSNQTDIIETLIPVCGKPVSTEPLWQCFLLSGSPSNQGLRNVNEQLSPMDGVSLQCCSKAVSSQCRTLCIQMYNKRPSSEKWSLGDDFNTACRYNKQETEMAGCLQDVEEPCNVGCRRLEFCSDFNGRMDTMFRSCNRKADLAARSEYSSWLRDKSIQLPSSQIVPIKDIRTCEPNMWKAISCTLNVKPCNFNSNSNKICKSDCIHILTRCVDDSAMTYDISALCDQLPVSEIAEQCIPLSQYIEPVENRGAIDFSNPCVPHPCNTTDVCEVNRNYPACRDTHVHCRPFDCRSGCPIGDTSALRVRANYRVKMLDTDTASPLSCQKICRCGHNGFLTHCQDTYCERQDSCIRAPDVIVEHGTKFETACNHCVCNSGEVICSQKYCSNQQSWQESVEMFGLPCGCLWEYEPVCTTNGQVFSSPCLARCAGFSDSSYNFGNCASRNPCGGNNCPHGFKCVPERKVCLSSSTDCPQHRCVPADCNMEEHGVVCDSQGIQHSNVCALLVARKQLSYVGRCMTHCAHDMAVCGVNGETYLNGCSAIADSIAVDYRSPCHSSPDATGIESACSNVKCEKKVPEWCQGVIPPGACCPVCGSLIRSLYSMSYVDGMIAHSDLSYITTKDMAVHLQHYLSNRYCSVYVYISFELELITLILPSSNSPTQDEVEFCNMDAQRITNMIETESPVLKTDMILSGLLTGSLHSSKIIAIPLSIGKIYSCNTALLTLLIILLFDIT